MRNGWDAILFDFDGVLVDSEPLHYACWAELVRGRFGIVLDWDYYHRHFIGMAERPMLAAIGRLVEPPVAVESLAALYGEKCELLREKMEAGAPFGAGVAELLAELAERFGLGLVTSSGRREVEPVIVRAGLAPLFGAAVYGEDVQRHKPDPEPYRTAAERLGARRALVVEDSQAGIASGRAAGFEVLQIPHADRTAELVRTLLALAGSQRAL